MPARGISICDWFQHPVFAPLSAPWARWLESIKVRSHHRREGLLATVADTVATWPQVIATAHWHLYRPSQIDGIDFYVGEHELGHIHLDGSIHLATSPNLGKVLVTAGRARPFPYSRGWVEEHIHGIGSPAAVALFRCNYDRLMS